jgi:hypothetical protein
MNKLNQIPIRTVDNYNINTLNYIEQWSYHGNAKDYRRIIDYKIFGMFLKLDNI